MVFRTMTKTGWTIITRGRRRTLTGCARPSLLLDQIGDRLCRLGGAETTVHLDRARARRARAAGITSRFQDRAQVALDLGKRVCAPMALRELGRPAERRGRLHRVPPRPRPSRLEPPHLGQPTRMV